MYYKIDLNNYEPREVLNYQVQRLGTNEMERGSNRYFKVKSI